MNKKNNIRVEGPVDSAPTGTEPEKRGVTAPVNEDVDFGTLS